MGDAGENPPAMFWTKNGFVDHDEWKKQNQKTKKTVVYPASVTSIQITSYGTLLNKCGLVFGSNEKATDESCGAIFRKIQNMI